jgi:hypothetical protein
MNNIDIKNVDWKSTLLVLVMRCISAGVVWAPIMLVLNLGSTMSTGEAFASAVIAPVAILFMFIFFVPIWLVAFWIIGLIMSIFLDDLGKLFFPFASACMAIFICVGDPILWLIKRSKPSFVPMEDFKFINFVSYIFIHNVQPESGLGEMDEPEPQPQEVQV